MFSKKRDQAAAKSFFDKAIIGLNGIPEKIKMDKSGANKAGIELHHMLKQGQHINSANQSVFEQFYALVG